MVPSTSVLRCEIDVEVRRLSDDPCELCDIAGRPRDVYETSIFDVECRLIRDGPIEVGVLSGSVLIRACERSGKRSRAGRKSGGAERGVAENDGAGTERGAGGCGAGTERGAG